MKRYMTNIELRIIRRALIKNQVEMAKILGISKGSMSRLENGPLFIPYTVGLRVLEFLKLAIDNEKDELRKSQLIRMLNEYTNPNEVD